jgi:hypothetical protein
VKLVRHVSAGFHSWEFGEIEDFEARHPIGSQATLALALLLYTEDVVRLGPQHVRGGASTIGRRRTSTATPSISTFRCTRISRQSSTQRRRAISPSLLRLAAGLSHRVASATNFGTGAIRLGCRVSHVALEYLALKIHATLLDASALSNMLRERTASRCVGYPRSYSYGGTCGSRGLTTRRVSAHTMRQRGVQDQSIRNEN